MPTSKVNQSDCSSCEGCLPECPQNAIIIDSSGFAYINPALCNFCDGRPKCQLECPIECIETID